VDDSAPKPPPSDADPRRRDEWIGINFLLGELADLNHRGLVLDDARRIIVGDYTARQDGIEKDLRFEAALKAVRNLSLANPKEALNWANRARDLSPDRPEGWAATLELLQRMRRFDEADTLAPEAIQKFPHLAGLVGVEAALKALQNLKLSSPGEALAWANRARQLDPDRPEAWVESIELLRRMKRFDEVDALTREALEKFPHLSNLAEGRRDRDKAEVLSYSRDRNYQSSRPEQESRPWAITEFLPDAVPPHPPKISWSGVAREFLEEHWQKLISCLAVLLIVVSSTVGANLVLGPLLWSPAGKGILALVFTSLCAAFGVGLVRWGAESAGKVMLATCLIVIPINLMLAGELKLLANPSSFEVGLVVVDAFLLFMLARAVVSALGFPSGATFTSAFFAMAIFNVGASRGMPFAVGFPVFLIPAAIFLGAVAWLNAQVRLKPGSVGEPLRLDLAYLEFGLLAFAFLSGVIRTGAVVLQLGPALYAIPAILAAIAVVSTSRAIEPIEKDRQRVLLFLQGGLALSALAFALSFARPGGLSALYSGNTLAVAVLGLALYSTSLRSTRKPAYLYCGFAAMFVAYFGAFYFAKDLVRSVEEAARQALGYDRPLPKPFRAINGLVFNVGLVVLSKFFIRAWSDDRLAKHCHYIGLPLSIAACVFSGFEPKAAVICLGGYTVLYGLGTWIYSEPRLIYLACAASAGSAYFGATLAGGATLGLRSMIASAIGLVFWAIRATPPLKRAGEAYRTPLIHSARVLAIFAMASATAASFQESMISPLATLAFALTAVLALLNGHESPRLSVYLLAIAALLGSWLGCSQMILGGQLASAMTYGLVIAGFAVALLLAGEAASAWSGRSEPSKAYLEAIGWAVPVIVLLSWLLAGSSSLPVSVTVARTFLVGASALLWLTRFRRESVLVYLGLAGLVIWVSCLCRLVAPRTHWSDWLPWLAITWGSCSLAIWGLGDWVRRRGSWFYAHPSFLVSGVLAVSASLLAIEARSVSVDSYRLGMVAMFEGALALGLIAASRQWPAAVVLSVASVVGAVDLAILSQGWAIGDAVPWLGMATAAQAIACRGVGWLIRRGSRSPDSSMARPLDFAALALLVLAIPLGYQSPTALLLIAAATLPMIGCFPSAAWLYGTFLAVGAAIYRAWLTGYSGDGLIPFVMLGAYLAWGMGAVLQRFGPGLLDRVGLTDLELEGPPVRTAVVLGVLASAIRLHSIVDSSAVWASLPWLPWTLAGLCLLMLKFDPNRGWVHAAVGLTGLGFAATLAPFVQPRGWWLASAMALSSFWAIAARGAGRVEESFRRRLGIAEGRNSGVLEEWSIAAFALAGTAMVGIVVGTSFLPGFGSYGVGEWSDVMLAIGLAGLFIAIEGRRFDRDGLWIGFEALAVAAIWWLGASGSPLIAWLNPLRDAYLPLATAACSLVVVTLGELAERNREAGVVDPSEPIATRWPLGLHRWTRWFGFGLSLASVYLAVYSTGNAALLTLILATLALGWLALDWREIESAIAGGLTWSLAWSVGLVQLDRAIGLTSSWGWYQIHVIAIGLTIGLFGLWTLAGWVRRRAVGKGGEPIRDGRVASALEWVAIGTTIPSAFPALIDGPNTILLGAVLLFVLAVFYAIVAARKLVEWPVYVAQLLLLGCYFKARAVLAPSGVADAVVLSLLGYLDLGLSELMARLRLAHYARPTFRFAMVLPLIPVVQGIWAGRWDGVDLFVLLATAMFYALTSARLRSKTPAYASAVFFNAFLWLAWYQLGWSMSDRPQFYLIPVGFSSILFAEVNRRELTRSVINGARNLGLVVIYASLAVPIWQTQSFWPWLVLLLLSLLGIFVGIGLKIQSFLWLGLACFVADLAYQLGRLGMEHALARWGVMLSLGVALILFVALNEKRRIVETMRKYYDEARTWE
jgi:tetratricopeptide (TPR) repeat protein